MSSERVFYTDANGIRIGTAHAAFGERTYATRDIRSVSLARDRPTRWPGVLVLFLGTGVLVWGAMFNSTWMLVGAAGAFSGSLYVRRRKTTYGVRVVTDDGPAIAFTSSNRRYVDQVVTAVRRAMAGSDEKARQPGSDGR